MYKGQTYQISLQDSGFNHNKNIDSIPPNALVHPSRNILLNEGGVKKRTGTLPVDTYALFKVGTPAFTGSGLDDLTAGSTFQNTSARTYLVEIDLAAGTDTFKWSVDDGDTWEVEDVAITGAAQTLDSAFTITFAATTGHTLGDQWEIAVTIPEITGIFDYHAPTGRYLVRATSDGQIWEGATGVLKSGWTADKKVNIIQAVDEVIFCNGADNPTVWDGSAGSTTDIANIPTDWSGSNFPQQMIMHGRGNSLRNWALGCPDTPKVIYVTPDGSPKDFTQATILTFTIETNDGFGVVGGIDFGDRLILFGKRRSFVIDDSDTNTDNWGYSEAQWVGGVAHWRLIIRTPNDIVCMMEDGEIYSVTAAEAYGDYRAASLTRPSFIHEWIKTYIKLSAIADFHATYDPVIRAIKFFMVRVGETQCNTALCYFIDRDPSNAWVILDNQDYESGYSALCSCIVRQSAGVWKIYTGGYNGRVWKLGEATQSDNAQAFVSSARLPLLTFGNSRESKRYDKLRTVSTVEGTCEATAKWWVDNEFIGQQAIAFTTAGVELDTFVLDTDTLGGANVLEETVRLGKIGKRIQVELTNNTAGSDFFFSQILIDFMPLGARP